MENSGLKKQYGLLMAICMVVGTVVGSGVFFKAQAVLNTTNGDMPMGIIAWIIGGLVMIFCVLAFCVMAQQYEKVNGLVDYAEATIGSKYAYMMGWFTTVLYAPAMTSVLAWLTARYFLTFMVSVNPDLQLAGDPVTGSETFLLAGFILICVFAVNTLSSKLAGKLQISATFVKLIPLLLMAVIGTIYGLSHDMTGAPVDASASMLSTNFGTGTGDFSTLFGAVVATAFAYEGWILATSINSEIKNSKKNLPIALILGGIIIIAVYLFYYIGIAGGAPVATLMKDGTTSAFTTVFGNVLGNILNLFVAVSCLGTLNGLLIGCIRGMYSVAVRGMGPKVDLMKQVDPASGMPSNSCIVGLVIVAGWLVYFYGANLTETPWFGKFSFDSSELPIITIYALYIPMFIQFMRKEKNLSPVKRFVLPSLGIIGSACMVIAAIYSHGYAPYMAAKEKGEFSCPVLFYLIVFVVFMAIGALFMKPKKKA
ncbi:MAG: APC family permease [Clostridia bacterium]|nr:APC family permease [Clostridia bacterium]